MLIQNAVFTPALYEVAAVKLQAGHVSKYIELDCAYRAVYRSAYPPLRT